MKIKIKDIQFNIVTESIIDLDKVSYISGLEKPHSRASKGQFSLIIDGNLIKMNITENDYNNISEYLSINLLTFNERK